MKRMFGCIVAIVGGGVPLWALTSYLGPTKQMMYGYDPVYGGLVGIGTLTIGILLARN